jgi:hypothetical protein
MKITTKLSLTALLILALSFIAVAQKPVTAVGTNVLKKELQMKLDEWHKAGKFPGATLGVVLADGESFGLAVGYSDRDAKTPMKPGRSDARGERRKNVRGGDCSSTRKGRQDQPRRQNRKVSG